MSSHGKVKGNSSVHEMEKYTPFGVETSKVSAGQEQSQRNLPGHGRCEEYLGVKKLTMNSPGTRRRSCRQVGKQKVGHQIAKVFRWMIKNETFQEIANQMSGQEVAR